MGNELSGRKWRDLTARMKDALPSEPQCWLCGDVIDLKLDGRTHRMALTWDHVIARAAGGDHYDPSNIRPAHRACNSRRAANPAGFAAKTSRRWR